MSWQYVSTDKVEKFQGHKAMAYVVLEHTDDVLLLVDKTETCVVFFDTCSPTEEEVAAKAIEMAVDKTNGEVISLPSI